LAIKCLFLALIFLGSAAASVASERAPVTAVRADISGSLRSALAQFSVDCGRYPTTKEGLKALMDCPTNTLYGRWHGPYLEQWPEDIWKHDYGYCCPGVHNTNGYDLYSCGFDGVSRSGGEDLDDINNWDPNSPHGGNDFALNYRQLILRKFEASPLYRPFLLILILIWFLGAVRLIASIFSRRVRDLIAQRPILHLVWLVVSLAAILYFLACTHRIAG
jgi:general secretion pathway protein G